MAKILEMAHSQLTRRIVLAGAMAAGAAPLLVGTSATASPKISKGCVRYSEVATDDHRCGDCRLFRAPSECHVVAGTVSQTCGCRIWLPKVA